MQSGLNIVAAGIGYGISEKVDAWTKLKPKSLEEYVSEMNSAGIGKVRHVFGWPVLVKDRPGHVALLYNDPGRGQGAVTKGQVGNITPLGGKVNLEKLVGFPIDRAYIAGGLMELDEHGGPTKEALEMFNSLQGLDYKILSSRDGQTLYVDGVPVMKFMKTKEGKEYAVELTKEGRNPANYLKLENLIVTYAIGLNPIDRVGEGPNKGKPVATAVINVWPKMLWKYIKKLQLGAEATAKGAKGLKSIPIRQLGKKYRTTVSNLVALALVGCDRATYKKLTGQEMPAQMPTHKEIQALKKAFYAEGYSIKQIVEMFNKEYPYKPKKEDDKKKPDSKKESAKNKKGKPKKKSKG